MCSCYLRHFYSQLFLIIKLWNRRFSWEQNQFQVWKLEHLCHFASGSIYKMSSERSAILNLRSIFILLLYVICEIPWERSREDKENVAQWRSVSCSQDLAEQKDECGSLVSHLQPKQDLQSETDCFRNTQRPLKSWENMSPITLPSIS